MPFTRPSLSALQNSVASDIAAALPGADALLRFSNLGITGRAQAGLANQHYGYLDWIAKQAVPFTCTDEYLEGWAALKGVFRLPATTAKGAVTFSGQPGSVIPAKSALVRGDGINFSTDAAATIGASGNVVVNASAVADPTGLRGAYGNTSLGSTMSLAQAIVGVQASGIVSSEFTGGQDLESNDNLRTRMLAAFQAPPQGGGQNDYINWTIQAPGVTRAWCKPNGFGVGTVVMFVMMDVLRAAQDGFPQGSDGVASDEARGAAASGDQLVVADYLYPLQSAVGLVYVVAPQPNRVNLSIQGLPASLRDAATNAIKGVLVAQGSPGGTIQFGHLWTAVANIAEGNYLTISPSTDIVCPDGQIPVLGNVSFL